MQQYLTLDEAAKLLHMSADELREMAKRKTIRAFQDRGTWRFRLQDVEETARKRGLSSDPELGLGEANKSQAAQKEDVLAADFSLDEDEVPLGKEKPSSGPRSGSSSGRSKGPATPKPGSDSDVRLVLDDDMQFDIDLSDDPRSGMKSSPPKTSSPKSAPKSPSPKSGQSPRPGSRNSRLSDPSDSGVRLVGEDDPNDSDVKVIPVGKDSGSSKKPKSPSDSDIRLQDMPPNKKKGRDAGVITEEIDLDAEEAKLAESSKHSKSDKGKGKGGRPATMVANSSLLPTDSPFEISEPDLNLDKPSKTGKAPRKRSTEESSSDFEAIPFDASKSPGDAAPGGALDSDDSVDLGAEIAGGRAGNSGINLQDPKDSGISLESGGSDEIAFDLSDEGSMTPRPASNKAAAKEDSSSEFELSIDDSDSSSSSEFELSVDDADASSSSEFELSVDDADASGSSEFELSLDASGESGVAEADSGSDSEFELTLDDDGGLGGVDEEGRDIFEETNFDVPALDDDSGSEAVAIDDADTDLEGSDFEISLDDSSSTGDDGSQVVSLDEDEEADEDAATIARARKTAKKTKTAAVADESEPELDVDLVASGKKGKKGAKAAVEEESDLDDEDLTRPAAYAAPADWGALPAVMLLPTVMVLFVVGLMGFELVRGMWGYHRPSAVGKPIIDTIARQIDETLPK